MKQKILSFITDGKKFLALRNNPSDPKHGGDFWFVVTGGVEKNESSNNAVIREVKEETNLDVITIVNLNWGSKYKCFDEECIEKNFLSFVKPGEVLLNEEKVEYQWLDLEEFVTLIRWGDNKNLLIKVLKKALNKDQYFKEEAVIDYCK